MEVELLSQKTGQIMFLKNGSKRKGNTKAKVCVEDFAEIKKLFHLDIKGVVGMDQTRVNYFQYHFRLSGEGSECVEIDGKPNNCCSMAGDFLCHNYLSREDLPKFKFPLDWSITYSANHWFNEGMMEEYILCIIFPYLSQMKEIDATLKPSFEKQTFTTSDASIYT